VLYDLGTVPASQGEAAKWRVSAKDVRHPAKKPEHKGEELQQTLRDMLNPK